MQDVQKREKQERNHMKILTIYEQKITVQLPHIMIHE